MSSIYVTTYEIIGEGLAAAERHYAEVDAARAAHWEYSESVGGIGFRPSPNGGIRSVFFDETPTGWRKIGRDRGKVEAVPNRGSKSGKETQRQMEAVPRVPNPAALAAILGYAPKEMALDPDRGTIYFPTEMRVSFPTPRSFIRLPRFAGDGFKPDESRLRAVAESELMKAVEDHNAEARRVREKEAA